MDSMTQDTLMFTLMAGLAAWVLFLLFRRMQQRSELQAKHLDLFNRAVDKFGTSQEFVSFLQSKEGQTMLYAQAPIKQQKSRSQLRFVQVGIILAVIGIACFLNAMQYTGETDINFIHKVQDLRYWGMLTIGLAIGLFLIAIVTGIWEKRFNGNGE